jgi:hypothetical protein
VRERAGADKELIEAAIRDYRKRAKQMVEPSLSHCEVLQIRKVRYVALRSRSEVLMVYEVVPVAQTTTKFLGGNRPKAWRVIARPELAAPKRDAA